MSENIHYTKVELCTYNGDVTKPWFVYFDITDSSLGITERKQFRGGINYYHSVKERLKAGDDLRKFWEKRLKQGWTPFKNTGVSNLSRMQFSEALDWALDRCKVAKKTKKDYGGTVRFFKKAAKNLGLEKALVTGINRQHIMLMLDNIREERSWSNHAYNKNAGFISAVMSQLEDYQVIGNNPANKIPPLIVAESNKYETLTDEEKLLIREKIAPKYPGYFTYLMIIYHTGIRPKEALSLKIKDIRLNKRMITIWPELDLENSKSKSVRMVPLNDHILNLLEIHLEGSCNRDYYVFGSLFEPGGNRGSQKGGIKGAMQQGYFLPSRHHMKRDTTTNLWKKLVWEGLGIYKYQYALKHTGGDDKILAGIPLDALRQMYGHSSKRMTEKYAKAIQGLYREQIIANSPEF